MSLGIADTVQLAASLVFAIPLGVLGGQYLLGGQTFLGGLLVVVAALMVVLPHVLTTPMDAPVEAAGKVVGKAVKTPDDDE